MIKFASIISGQIAVVVAEMCKLDVAEKAELHRQFNQVREDVMGNRPGNTIVTPTDAKRMLLLRLRLAVGVLERDELKGG